MVGLLLAQEATTSAIDWWSSSDIRWMRSRLSRKARDTACSTALGGLVSGDMPVFGVFLPEISRFVILEGKVLGVNRLAVLLCPEVTFPQPRLAPPSRWLSGAGYGSSRARSPVLCGRRPTGASPTGANTQLAGFFGDLSPWLSAGILGFVGIVAVPGKQQRQKMRLALGIVVLGSALGAGCGGGSSQGNLLPAPSPSPAPSPAPSPSPNPSGTPAGTYSVTVTATGNGNVTHNTAVVLTVN